MHNGEEKSITLELNHQGFEENLHLRRPWINGIQYVFKFENNYGASVVKFPGSYGSGLDLWELVILYFEEYEWIISHGNPVSDDVIGSLTDEEVREYLRRIKEIKNEN